MVFLRRAVGLTEGFWTELLFLEAGDALVVCSFFFRENMFTLLTEIVPQIFKNELNTCENVFSCFSVTDSYFPIMRVQLLAPARALSLPAAVSRAARPSRRRCWHLPESLIKHHHQTATWLDKLKYESCNIYIYIFSFERLWSIRSAI